MPASKTSSPTDAVPARSPRRDGLRVAIAFTVALVGYLVLSQDSLWGDGDRILRRIERGEQLDFNSHFLLPPLIEAVHGLLAPLGATLFQSAVLVDAFSVAIGVAFVCAAVQRLPRDSANDLRIALLVAATPAVAFFATVVEFHALFFGCAALAFLAAARLAARPNVARAVGLGAATAFATLAHATGHLLVLGLVPLALALAIEARPLARRRWIALGALAAGAHAVLFRAVEVVLRMAADARVSSEVASMRLMREVGKLDPSEVLGDFLIEYLVPFFPLSIVALAALFRRDTRALATVYALGALPYLFVSMVLGQERGAYSLPIAFPAALVVARFSERRVFPLLVVLALVVGVGRIVRYDRSDYQASVARGLVELSDDRPMFLLVAGFDDLDLHFIHLPETDVFDLPQIARLHPGVAAIALPAFDEIVGRELDGGKRVFLTLSANDALHAEAYAERFPGRVVVREHMETTYSLEPVSAHAFTGWRIERRIGTLPR